LKLEKVENISSTLLVRFVRLIIKGEQCERSPEITIGEIKIGEITFLTVLISVLLFITLLFWLSVIQFLDRNLFHRLYRLKCFD